MSMEHEIVTAPDLAPPVGYAHAVVAAPGRARRTSAARPRWAPTATIAGATMAEQFDVAARQRDRRRCAPPAASRRTSSRCRSSSPTSPPTRPRCASSARVVAASTSAAATRPPGLFGVTRLFDDEALIELMASPCREACDDRGVASDAAARRAPRATTQLELLRATAEVARDALRAARRGTTARARSTARSSPRSPSTGCSAGCSRDDEGWRRTSAHGAVPHPRGAGARAAPRPRRRSRSRASARSRCCSPATRLVEAWVPRLAAGEAVAGFALTEPDAGSDVAALALRAEPDGDGFRLHRREDLHLQRARRRRLHRLRPHDARAPAPAGSRRSWCPRDARGPDRRAASSCVSPHPIGRLRLRRRRTSRASTCSARSTAASASRCARSTCSAPASARSRSGWRRRRSPPRSRTPPRARRSAGRCKDFQAVSHRLADVATRVQARAAARPPRRDRLRRAASGR